MKLGRFGLAVVFLTLSCLSPIRAQDYPYNVHQQTSTPPNARYEIAQSEFAAGVTFRLDRFTGHVSRLGFTKEGNNAWEVTRVIELPVINSPSRPRFQIFTSGIIMRHTLLIDTDTGKTWMVESAKRKNADGTEYGEVVWEPFD
jgi:hypothetical protein